MEWKRLILGALAGALALLGLMLLVYLGLFLYGLLFEYARQAIALAVEGGPAGAGWRFLGQAVAVSVQNAARGLWQARVATAVCGALGVLAAFGHSLGQALSRKRVWLASYLTLAVGVALPTIVWSIVQREEVRRWILESPELYAWKDMLLASYASEIAVTLIFALALSFPLWSVWRWLYSRLCRWLLGADWDRRPAGLVWAGPRRRPWGLIVVAVAFVCCVVLLVPVSAAHRRARLHLQHGVAWVDEHNQQVDTFPVEIRPRAQRIRIVNVKGMGIVSVYLSPADDARSAVRSLEHWSFEWRLDEYLYNDLPVARVPPGDYLLHFVQEEGWGYFEYTLGAGGGAASHQAALAMGLLIALALALGGVLLFLVALRLGWIELD